MALGLNSRYGSTSGILENVYKTRQKRNYIQSRVQVYDKTDLSLDYFVFADPPTYLTSGKNSIKFKADGRYLKGLSSIDFEVLDVNGDPLYVEFTSYKDRLGYSYATIYVYDLTPPGIGSITFTGIAKYFIDNGKLIQTNDDYFNLIWSKQIDIRPLERNNSDIIFVNAPKVEVTQVLVPYTFNLGTYALASSLFTQSLSGLSIVKSDNVGFDFIESKTNNIIDEASKDNTYNYFADSITTNTVQTNIRIFDKDVVNGYVYSEYNRFNAYLYDPQSRLTKDMEGSIFTFGNEDGGASYTSSWQFYPPYTSSTLSVYGEPVQTQLDLYKVKIVNVLNNTYALLEQAPSVKLLDNSNTTNPLIYNQTFKKVENVTGSFTYPKSTLNQIQSQNLSSSFIQFTITGLEPIIGDVYRIKTYVKEAGSSAEYKQLNDHIVVPPEYLIDSDKANQAVYAKNKSDAFVYGEITEQSIATEYWRGFGVEQDGKIYQYSNATTSSYPLANSVELTSNNSTIKRGIASRYYQTYIPNEPFSLSFYCALDPGCELEVYMSSTPLKDNALGIQGPKAFNETVNRDGLMTGTYSRLGKLIGKVSNLDGNIAKTYDNLVFDFYPDSDGFGRPVIYLNTTSDSDKKAYISSISVTPLDLVGYTPSILQFAAQPPDSLWILQDDDASLTQSIDLKIEYFNYEGKQSEYTTYIPNVQINLITEVPGFCSAESSRFNDHCPLYYEVTTNGTTNTGAGTEVTKDPESYYNRGLWPNDDPIPDLYFWPTYSLNNGNGFNWNIINFGIGPTYNSASLLWHTSSNTIDTLWRKFDPIMPVYDQPMPGTAPFLTMYSASTAGVFSRGDDNQLFWKSNGAVISPIDIAKLVDTLEYSSSLAIQQNQTHTDKLNTYLKRTRLYFPTNEEVYNYGFNENGGIYNVRFNLKRWPQYQKVTPPLTNSIALPGVAYEDSGWVSTTGQVLDNWAYLLSIANRYSTQDGAKLMVYIHDVSTPLVTQSIWQKGTPGFYPPDNNIVTIGNGYSTTPTLRYLDTETGAYVDTYDIILVQYGDRAQLTFDASGIELSLEDSGYYNIRHVNNGIPSNPPLWGGMISDIEWCKIGTTTDPRFIKPANFADVFTQRPKRGTWVADTIIQTGQTNTT